MMGSGAAGRGDDWVRKQDKPVNRRIFPGRVILAQAGSQKPPHVPDAGTVIPDLIRDRHDQHHSFDETVK